MKKLSINKDISIAETMPSYFYLDENYYKLSINKIFKKSWQFAILLNQFKNQNLSRKFRYKFLGGFLD